MIASEPAAASTAAIPFGHGGGVISGSGSAIGVTLLLLVAAYAVLWYARKRGWLGHVATSTGTGMVVEQRFRLGATSTAYVLRDGEQRLLVVESRHGVQLTRLDNAEANS